MGLAFNGEEHDFTAQQRSHVEIVKDRVYRHKILRVNYTTYDMRRDQDSINPSNHADIMVLNPGEDSIPRKKQHPYWYARVCGVFHANARYTGPGTIAKDTRRVEFLWVRWFGVDPDFRAGFLPQRLHRVGFTDGPRAITFLNPDLVLRSVHLIPAFAHGKTEYLGSSVIRRELPQRDIADWTYYYVGT